MVKTALFALTVFALSIPFGTSLTLANDPNIKQDLRLYRVNKDGISDRFWFTRGKARQPGCHNLRTRSRLHRAVQFGYSVCQLYTQKNCAAASIVSFTRDDDAQPTTDLQQGYSWFVISDHPRGMRVKSWLCNGSASMPNSLSKPE